MKLKVNRELNGGLYSVDFSVGEFTPDEVQKMRSFGVPRIEVYMGGPPPTAVRQSYQLQITGITPQYKANFATEAQAKDYEERVVAQIREAMKSLRERKDDFSSFQEVDV
jgi:hypothetical protein